MGGIFFTDKKPRQGWSWMEPGWRNQRREGSAPKTSPFARGGQNRRGKGRGDSSRGHRQERKPSQEPDETVVLKDLPKSLESDQLLDILRNYEIQPESLHYHYDHEGNFSGIAMVQYGDTEKSSAMLALLNDALIEEQTIRAEFKHKKIEETQEYQEYHEQLTQFRDNEAVSELRFNPGLTPFQRKQIHQICTKLHLGHESVGTGGDRYILVSKKSKDWSPSTRGHSFPRGKNTALEAARKAVQVDKVEPQIRPSRTPIIPDGTTGFSDEFQVARRLEIRAHTRKRIVISDDQGNPVTFNTQGEIEDAPPTDQ